MEGEKKVVGKKQHLVDVPNRLELVLSLKAKGKPAKQREVSLKL